MKLMNLFQMFDPSSLFGPSHSFMVIILLTILLFKSEKSKMKSFKKFFSFSELGSSLGVKNSMKFFSLFIFISSMNLLSLLPSSFSSTSQIALNLPMALSVWLSVNLLFTLKNMKGFLSHLVPAGSPNFLIPLMVLIELVSNMIRPITLSVRLTANIVAGHLLVALLEKTSGSPIPMILLYTLESAVAIIQGYIFSLLTLLYFSEVH